MKNFILSRRKHLWKLGIALFLTISAVSCSVKKKAIGTQGNSKSSVTYHKKENKRLDLEQIRSYLLNKDTYPHVLLALHRAYWTHGIPENSQESVNEALKIQRVEIIEVDVKVSSDGTVYLMHDNYLQRTTNFLDVVDNKFGEGTDNYGKSNQYEWNFISKLKLKNEEKTYTDYTVPSLYDIIAIINGSLILQLDINDTATFDACIKLVQQMDAFRFVMFKGSMTVNQFLPYYEQLNDKSKSEIIFAPIVKIDSKPDGGLESDPVGFYNEWSAWHNLNKDKAPGVAGIYEMVYKTSADTVLFTLGEKIRNDGIRLGIFSAQPEYYLGRYRGNVNINQCCADTHQTDRRGDLNFILAPNGNEKAGINGYILTDEVESFYDNFY